MKYSQITIPVYNSEHAEIIMAWLSENNYLGSEEQDDQIIAYSNEGLDKHASLIELLQRFSIEASFASLEEQNWNALWESNFEPVIIPGKIIVRAHFHETQSGFKHEIKITPKMSFGTGHHATTKMMMLAMLDSEFKGKRIIDFGTGTGILAILAEKLGGVDVDAIDNDPWSVENALENIHTNQSKCIKVSQAENIHHLAPADVILANINKHILLEHVESLSNKLKDTGLLIISGLLNIDYEDIVYVFSPFLGMPVNSFQEGEWIALCFKK